MNRVSVEEWIKNLCSTGISLNENFSLSTVLEDFDGDEGDIEKNPYEYLLMSIAANEFSDVVAEFGIIVPGDDQTYGDIFLKLDSMTGGTLGITNVKDNFEDLFSSDEHGFKDARLEFRCKGKKVSYDLLYESNYLDPNLFFRFNELLTKHDIGYQIYHYPLDESGIFIALKKESLNKLEKLLTGIEEIAYSDYSPNDEDSMEDMRARVLDIKSMSDKHIKFLAYFVYFEKYIVSVGILFVLLLVYYLFW